MFLQRGCLIFFIICSKSQLCTSRQLTLHDKNLVVAAVPWPPFVVLRKDENGTDILSGVLGKFFQYIKEARNCTFKVVRPPDGLFGNCNGMNNCTGMIGQVNRREADFAIGLFHHKSVL